ncbi:MAG: hypothetical protein H6Q60_1399 [Oscillospiraceae bacterium]|nr:hypothetical protein [Oscillospiraceae bacterium]
MSQISTLLALAATQIGITESPADSNTVKYNTEYYGKEVSGSAYPWCMVFQWWLFYMCGLSSLFYGGSKTASCSALLSWAKKKRYNVTWDYQPGDLILFNFSGGTSTQHVGICESVTDTTITTIDGNTGTSNEANGGAVMRRTRNLSYVVAAFRPQYTEDTTTTTTTTEDDDMTDEVFAEKMDTYLTNLKAEEPSDWSEEARTWAIDQGLIKGDGEGNYMWKASVTREALAQIMHRQSQS